MSLWGWPIFFKAPNAYLIIDNFIFIMQECLDITINVLTDLSSPSPTMVKFTLFSYIVPTSISNTPISNTPISNTPISAKNRIGVHNLEILNILFGSLLGHCQAEFRSKGKGTRFCFYQESSHVAYLIWLHSKLAKLGYCHTSLPEIKTKLGKKGIVKKVVRFKTWTYSSLNWIHDLWYINNTKVVPSNIGDYLNPLALAIWIMVDGSKVKGDGIKLCTYSFTYLECILLVKVLFENFNIKSTIRPLGTTEISEQYHIYIWKESMPLLREIVLPYVHPSMKYKLGL